MASCAFSKYVRRRHEAWWRRRSAVRQAAANCELQLLAARHTFPRLQHVEDRPRQRVEVLFVDRQRRCEVNDVAERADENSRFDEAPLEIVQIADRIEFDDPDRAAYADVPNAGQGQAMAECRLFPGTSLPSMTVCPFCTTVMVRPTSVISKLCHSPALRGNWGNEHARKSPRYDDLAVPVRSRFRFALRAISDQRSGPAHTHRCLIWERS